MLTFIRLLHVAPLSGEQAGATTQAVREALHHAIEWRKIVQTNNARARRSRRAARSTALTLFNALLTYALRYTTRAMARAAAALLSKQRHGATRAPRYANTLIARTLRAARRVQRAADVARSHAHRRLFAIRYMRVMPRHADARRLCGAFAAAAAKNMMR